MSSTPDSVEDAIDSVMDDPTDPPLGIGEWELTGTLRRAPSGDDYDEREWLDSLEYTNWSPEDIDERRLILRPTNYGREWELVLIEYDIPNDAVINTMSDKEEFEDGETLSTFDDLDDGLSGFSEELQTHIE